MYPMMWAEIILICFLIIVVICLICIWHASTHFHKVYYRLSSDKISKPVKFVLLSDLHDKTYGSRNSDLLGAIEEECPDAVLVAGDMLTAGENRDNHVAEDLILALTSQYPVYYGMGNHEAKMNWHRERYGNKYDDYMAKMNELGAVVLSNRCVKLKSQNICIFGLDMPERYYKRFKKTPMDADYMQRTLGQADTESYNILLAHNPNYFEEYAQWKADLVLSGHVHGGLVRLPFLGGVVSPSIEFFPRYDGGKFTQDKSTMILSRGLGFHSVEFRMWNPGELVILELSPAKDK